MLFSSKRKAVLQVLVRKRKVGRPRGSRKQKPPSADARLQRVAAAARRPLAIKPASLAGRYQQVVCHVASKDGRPRPVLMLKPVGLPAPALTPPSVPKFTANQVGRPLYRARRSSHIFILGV